MATNALSHYRRLTRCPVCYGIIPFDTFPEHHFVLCHNSNHPCPCASSSAETVQQLKRRLFFPTWSRGTWHGMTWHDMTQRHGHSTASSLNHGGWPYCTVHLPRMDRRKAHLWKIEKLFTQWVESYHDVTRNYNTNTAVDFRVWWHGKVWRRRIFRLLITKLPTLLIGKETQGID